MASMVCASSREAQRGFSQKKALLAAAAFRINSAWVGVGVQMATACTESSLKRVSISA